MITYEERDPFLSGTSGLLQRPHRVTLCPLQGDNYACPEQHRACGMSLFSRAASGREDNPTSGGHSLEELLHFGQNWGKVFRSAVQLGLHTETCILFLSAELAGETSLLGIYVYYCSHRHLVPCEGCGRKLGGLTWGRVSHVALLSPTLYSEHSGQNLPRFWRGGLPASEYGQKQGGEVLPSPDHTSHFWTGAHTRFSQTVRARQM